MGSQLRTVRVGVIGVGQIGKHHLENYTKVPGVEVVALADVNAEELARVGEKYKVQRRHTDFRQLLRDSDIEAVDVCLHNNFHAPVSIAAIEAGKHVYCEKPIAGSYVDGVAMVQAAQRTGRLLSIQLSSLFSKETKAARRLIKEGRLGRPYHARSCGHRRRGRPFVDGYGTASFVQKKTAAGGALLDMGIYHIAQMLYLLGCPSAQRISGKTYQETAMDEGRRKSSGYDVEELGMGFVRFEGGLTLDIIESWAIHLDTLGHSYIAGSDGGLRLAPLKFCTTLGDATADVDVDVDGTDWRLHQLNPLQSAYDSAQHHWIAAVRGDVPLEPTAQLALETMLISEGIYLSDKLGREVTADEVKAASVSTALKV